MNKGIESVGRNADWLHLKARHHVEKFNQNHDERGRFSSATGTASVTSKLFPSTSKDAEDGIIDASAAEDAEALYAEHGNDLWQSAAEIVAFDGENGSYPTVEPYKTPPTRAEMVEDYKQAVLSIQNAWGSQSNSGLSATVQQQVNYALDRRDSLSIDSLPTYISGDDTSAYFSDESFLPAWIDQHYTKTQAKLAAAGVKDLTVYRGVQLSDEFVTDMWGDISGADSIQTRPLSSTSLNRSEAEWFAAHGDMFWGGALEDEAPLKGYVVTTTVPAADVFSVAGLGFTSLTEVVTLGGWHPGTVEPAAVKKSVQKYNRNHDARGRFASGENKYSTSGDLTTVFNHAEYVAPSGEKYGLSMHEYQNFANPDDTTVTITADDEGGREAGRLTTTAMQAGHYEVAHIGVEPLSQRKGLATAMLEFGRQHASMPIRHSAVLTSDGKAWAAVAKFNPNHDERGRFSTGGYRTHDGRTIGRISIVNDDGSTTPLAGFAPRVVPSGTKNREVAARIGPARNSGSSDNIDPRSGRPLHTTTKRATYTAADGTEYKMILDHHHAPANAAEGQAQHDMYVVSVGARAKANPIYGMPSEAAITPEGFTGIMRATARGEIDWGNTPWWTPGTGDKDSPVAKPSTKGAEIEWIEVQPEHRRNGLGTAMVEFARRDSDSPIVHSASLTDLGEEFVSVVKFNQNHDARGRFSTGPSSSQLTLPGMDEASVPTLPLGDVYQQALVYVTDEATAAARESARKIIAGHIRKRLEGQPFGKRLQVGKLHFIGTSSGTYYFSGEILDESGKRVGDFERSLTPYEVKHNLFQIDRKDQGTGFGTEFSAASEAMYLEMGIDRITLETGLSKGGYVWAKAGYEWNYDEGEHSIGDVADRMENIVSSSEGDGGDMDVDTAAQINGWLSVMVNSYSPEEYPQPYQIAELVDADGREWGREIMEGAQWHGEKRLYDMNKASSYARMFDNFTRTRKLDLDDAYWSDEDKAAWAALRSIQKYNQNHGPDGRFSTSAGDTFLPGWKASNVLWGDAEVNRYSSVDDIADQHRASDMEIAKAMPMTPDVAKGAYDLMEITPEERAGTIESWTEQFALWRESADWTGRDRTYIALGYQGNVMLMNDTSPPPHAIEVKGGEAWRMAEAYDRFTMFRAANKVSAGWNTDSNDYGTSTDLQGILKDVGLTGQTPYADNFEWGVELDDYTGYGAFLGAYAKATYAHTQTILAKRGVKGVVAYRGLDLDKSHEWEFSQTPESPHDIAPNALNSFSTDVTAAKTFAANSSGDGGWVLRVEVPAKDIFSIGGHGPGATVENEITVLGPDSWRKPSLYQYGTGATLSESGNIELGMADEWEEGILKARRPRKTLGGIGKRDDSVQKYNRNHGADGRFTSGSGVAARMTPFSEPRTWEAPSGDMRTWRSNATYTDSDGIKHDIEVFERHDHFTGTVFTKLPDGTHGNVTKDEWTPVDLTAKATSDTGETGLLYAYQGNKGTGNDWTISSLDVRLGYRRRGIATAMLMAVRAQAQGGSKVHHSSALLPDGKAFAAVVKYNQNHDAKGRFASGSGIPVMDLKADASKHDGTPVMGDDGVIRLRTARANFIAGTPETFAPLEHIYRAISAEDWKLIQERGYMQTDGRMNLDPSEGTVATNHDPSFYLPTELGTAGRIVRMDYHKEDGWRVDPIDSYLKTPNQIPLSRITAVSPYTTGTGGHAMKRTDPRFMESVAWGLHNKMSDHIGTARQQTGGWHDQTDAVQALSDFAYKGPEAIALRTSGTRENIMAYTTAVSAELDKIGSFEKAPEVADGIRGVLDAARKLIGDVRVRKYNQNHDERGRFATASGKATPAPLFVDSEKYHASSSKLMWRDTGHIPANLHGEAENEYGFNRDQDIQRHMHSDNEIAAAALAADGGKNLTGAYRIGAPAGDADGLDANVKLAAMRLGEVDARVKLDQEWGRTNGPTAWPRYISLSTQGHFNITHDPDDNPFSITSLGRVRVDSIQDFHDKVPLIVYRAATSKLSRAWNERSNANAALLIQDAIEPVLGRKGVSLAQIGHNLTWQDDMQNNSAAKAFAHEYTKAVYDRTQSYLAASGVTEVVAHRGFKMFSGVTLDTGTVTPALRPLSSFTTSPPTAVRFSNTYENASTGYVHTVKVKAEDIFSIGGIGPGAEAEGEIIAMPMDYPGTLMQTGTEAWRGSEGSRMDIDAIIASVDPKPSPYPPSPFAKYNRNHDEKGRFSTAPAASTKISVEAYSQESGAWAHGVLAETLPVIAAVHEAPRVTSIKVRVVDPATLTGRMAEAEGWYNRTEAGVLNLKHGTTNTGGTIIHEFGHMLDTEQFSMTPEEPHTMNVYTPGNSPMHKVMGEIIQSESFRRIAVAGQMGIIDQQTDEYLRHPAEAFARAYHQWIVTRAGSIKLRAELDHDIANVAGQWEHTDFAPIARAMDHYFASEGLISGPPKLTPGLVTHAEYLRDLQTPNISKYNRNHDARGRFATSDGSHGLYESGIGVPANKRPGNAAYKPNGGVHERAGRYEPLENGWAKGGSDTALSIREIAEREFDVIEKVHALPDQGIVQVSMTGEQLPHAMASYRPSQNVIDLHPTKVRPGDFAHEYGHALDHRFFATKHQQTWHTGASDRGAVTEDLNAALTASPTIKAIDAASSDIYARDTAFGGMARQAYLLHPAETFARGYFQWIATKSGDAGMLGTLDAMRTDPAWAGYQWPDDEFAPISAAYDSMFASKGLLK